MPQSFPSLRALLDHGFDAVIDVRSPAEYALDHIPGAISLPALSNEERAEVGTIYKQISAFSGRKIGAAMVARNVATHLEGPLAPMLGGWRPLIYCWRGGQRSGSFASILTQIGWRAETVEGGYQSYRRLVQQALYETPLPHKLILLDGYTGTAKTDLLAHLANRGLQTLDLEGLAGHRGSLLGGTPAGQPNQKAFETGLSQALLRLDPTRPVLVEAESSKIGRIVLPPVLWSAMCIAPRIEVDAPLTERAAYLTRTYADIIADPDRLIAQLQPLRAHRGHAIVDHWLALLQSGDLIGLATALMSQHYDPAYAKSRALHENPSLAQFQAKTLDAAGQEALADQIFTRLNAA